MLYILKDKKPVKVDIKDCESWAKNLDDNESRIVMKTTMPDGVEVSSVFIGVDMSSHLCETKHPVCFETMIFGGERDLECHRSRTWEQCEETHDRIVESLRSN